MSDKLQFVVVVVSDDWLGSDQIDKLKFVGHLTDNWLGCY
jgi:hypothetical protein